MNLAQVVVEVEVDSFCRLYPVLCEELNQELSTAVADAEEAGSRIKEKEKYPNRR